MSSRTTKNVDTVVADKEIFEFFMKPKKIWLKEFSKNEVAVIFNAFMKATNVTIEELKEAKKGKISFSEKKPNFPLMDLAKEKAIPTPESDCYDDLLGVHPKTIKKIFEHLSSLSEIEEVIRGYPYIPYIKDEDEDINWDKSFKTHFQEFKANSQKNFPYNTYMRNYIKSKEAEKEDASLSSFLDKTSLYLSKEDFDRKIEKIKLLRKEKLNTQIKEYLKQNFSIKVLEDEWKSTHRRVPKALLMLGVHPGNVDFKNIQQIKTILDLDPQQIKDYETAMFYMKLLNLFGVNIGNYLEEINANILVLKKLLSSFHIPRVERIIVASKMPIFVAMIFFLINRNLSAEEKNLLNSDEEFLKELNQFSKYVLNNASEKAGKFVNAARSIGMDTVKHLIKYNISFGEIIDDVVELERLYAARINETIIPEIAINKNGYTGKIVRDKSALICGYATDCCMVIDGAGESCLKYGFLKSNSSFFLIKRKNQILAQSWVWEFEYKESKILVVDSIEVLGKNLDKSSTILEIYSEFIEQMSDKYEYIIIGADGNTSPKGIGQLGEIVENIGDVISDFDFYKIKRKYNIGYTDVKSSVIVLNTKDLK